MSIVSPPRRPDLEAPREVAAPAFADEQFVALSRCCGA